jgi:hypothetical protein
MKNTQDFCVFNLYVKCKVFIYREKILDHNITGVGMSRDVRYVRYDTMQCPGKMRENYGSLGDSLCAEKLQDVKSSAAY